MKRAFIILFALFFAAIPFFVFAQPRYEADFSFSVAVNGKTTNTNTEYIYIYNYDTIELSLRLKTNEDFFAGPFCTEIFFTKNFLTNSTLTWNTTSKFYNCCKTYSNALLQSNGSYKVDMIPTSTDCKSAPNSLDENIFKIRFVAAGQNDNIAQVQIPQNIVRNASNPFGSMYLACYSDSGNLNGNRYDFGGELKLDVSEANVKFKFTSAGNVNQDSKISSHDALLIIQYSTGLIGFDQQKLSIADLTADGKVSSSDALAVLQISTGLKIINEVLNK